ncbi:hypothetical protein [Pontibacter sp. H249]|uniref:hypothetical protein n=1 Tax=Pontibacter sp. H249 TaxID=3133420 RepID=UPI0030BE6A1D
MTKKFNLRSLGLSLVAAMVFTACQKDDDVNPIENKGEFKHVRVLVTDESATKLTQINPATAGITSFDTKFPMGNLYATANGRFAAVVYGSQNLTEMFDTGLEFHGNHVDMKGTPKWAAITAAGSKPAHFKSRGAESLIFNDGDGTLHLANEANFHTPSAQFTTINAGLTAHHGAMAQFDNGNIAVTESGNRVRVINKNGGLVHASTVEVARIHGNATDGTNAVFGSFISPDQTTGGVLVVNQTGEQRVIANPAGFGAVRLGTILYGMGAKKFVGYGATKGAYMIDLAANKITPIYNGTDAVQCKMDYAGNNLLVLTMDGKLRVYNLSTGALKKEGMVISPVASGDSFKPVIEATAKYAYIAMPNLGEVHQVNLDDFNKVVKHKVSAKPVRLTLLGFETDESH